MARSRRPAQELVEAVEVAFAEVRAEEDDAAASPSGAGDGNGDDGSGAKTEIKTKVAKALGVEESGGEPTSRTLQRVQELSEEASIAFVKARDYLEFVKIYIEDRVERDSALLMATIDTSSSAACSTRRVLSAAAEATRPVLLLAEDGHIEALEPDVDEELVLGRAACRCSGRRLEAFRFNDDEERRINAAYRKQLSARPAAPTRSTSSRPRPRRR